MKTLCLCTLVLTAFLIANTYAAEEERLTPDSIELSAISAALLSDNRVSRIQLIASVTRTEIENISVFFLGDWITVPNNELYPLKLPELDNAEMSVLNFDGKYRLAVQLEGYSEVYKGVGGLKSTTVTYYFIAYKYAYKKVSVADSESYFLLPNDDVKYSSDLEILEQLLENVKESRRAESIRSERGRHNQTTLEKLPAGPARHKDIGNR